MQTAILNHYPPVIKQIKEIQQIAKAEDIEFSKLEIHAKRCIGNQFILIANESGIARFETMLEITPSKSDSLEVRRARVLARWYNAMPYSLETLKKKIQTICEGKSPEIKIKGYEIKVTIPIEPGTDYMLPEVQEMLEEFLPLNLYYLLEGVAKRERRIGIHIGSTRAVTLKIKVEPNSRDSHTERKASIKTSAGALMHIKTRYQTERG